MNAIRRKLALATSLALALLLGACGGGDNVNCSQNPTGPGCVQASPSPPIQRPPFVLDGGEGSLPAFVALFRTLPITETGSFEVIVDWTFATNDIDIFLARGDCSFDQFVGGGCNYAATATSPTTKPERLRLANQPAGTYTLIVPNFGPADESISYQVIFTPGTSATSASRGSVDVPMDKVGRLVRGIVKK
jgi:hypothetical protein